MSDLLTLCTSLTARAAHVATGEHLEIELSDGGNVFFLTDPKGGFCAGGITDNADPELKKTLGAAMEKLGLPMFSIPIEKAPDSLADVARLLAEREQA